MEVYLDNSATTPVDQQVLLAMEPYWQNIYANPSSPHAMGVKVESVLEQCRRFFAQSFKVKPSEILFTSGGTEANNLAILGFAHNQYQPGHIITTNIEHPSVTNPINYLATDLGWEIDALAVNQRGQIDPFQLKEALRKDTALVSVGFVNNEIGTIQNLDQISEIITTYEKENQQRIIFHVDGCQAFGTIPIHLSRYKIDLLSISGHKFFGPKGIGLLYVKEDVRLKPLLFGGNQENGIRSGTENIPGIVGITKAAQLALENLDTNYKKLVQLRQRLLTSLNEIPDCFCNSPHDSSPHIISIGFTGVKAEVLVHFLEQAGVYVSIGAACSSRKNRASHVLTALGLTPEAAAATIRISLAPQLIDAEIDYAAKVITKSVAEIRNIYG